MIVQQMLPTHFNAMERGFYVEAKWGQEYLRQMREEE